MSQAKPTLWHWSEVTRSGEMVNDGSISVKIRSQDLRAEHPPRELYGRDEPAVHSPGWGALDMGNMLRRF